MKITRDELLKYAAHGVRDRLHAMQKELNELARLFPGIVCHQDGTVPSVLPVELKPAAKANGHVPAKRQTKKYAAGAKGYWAKMTPAQRSKEMAKRVARRAVTLAKQKS